MTTVTIFRITRTACYGWGTEDVTETFMAAENPDAPHEVIAIDGSGRFADKVNAAELTAVGTLDDEIARGLVAAAEAARSTPQETVTFRDEDDSITLRLTSSIDPTSEAMGTVRMLVLESLATYAHDRRGPAVNAIIHDLTKER